MTEDEAHEFWSTHEITEEFWEKAEPVAALFRWDSVFGHDMSGLSGNIFCEGKTREAGVLFRGRHRDRPLLARFPELLEHSGVLRHRLRPRRRDCRCDPRRLLALDLPDQVRLPVARARLSKLTLTLTMLWLLSYVAILVQMPNPDPVLRTISLLYLVYYFGVSFYISWKMHKPRRMA